MIENKALVGKLNLDDSPNRLPKEDFVYSLNTTLDAVQGSNDLVRTNIVGNRLVNYTLPIGTNKVIGAYSNTIRNTVIYFVYNSNGYHSILEYNDTSRTITPIFINLTDSANVDILGFLENNKITSVNVFPRTEGDLLYFLDSLGRPTKMDITAFKAGAYTPVTRDIIDLAVRPSLTPPQAIYGNDTTRRVNNHRNKLYRFCYRYVYDDFSKSTTSPINELALPVSILSDVYTNVITNNNLITISLNSGDKDVKEVELLMSYVEKSNDWSDFVLVSAIDKAKQSISDNVIFSFQFYNDSVYPVVDQQDVILLFDYVPDSANCMEMPNGNVIMFGGITEGYNRTLTPNVTNTVTTYPVAAPSSGTLISITSRRNPIIFNWRWNVYLSGIPVAGTTVVINLTRTSDSATILAATYTTVSGDSVSNVINGLSASMSGLGISSVTATDSQNITFTFAPIYDDTATCVITPATTSSTTNSIPVWKWSSERNIGIAYFDKKGKTNGILYNSKVTFPAYAENGSNEILLPKLNTKIYHVPPDWAYSYQFYFTKDNSNYIFWETNAVNTAETDFIYFDVTGFLENAKKNPTTAAVCSYSFQDGDRLRLIKPVGVNSFFADTYDAAILGLVANPRINGTIQTDRQFLKIKKVAPFDTAFTTNFQNYLIEIYRPEQQSATGANQVYYECGRQFPILNPTTATRVHGGEVTDQSTNYVTPAEVNFTKGDAYFRPRTIALTDSGSGTFSVMDRNFVDFYISAVNSISGRANLIDVNARRQYYSTLVRFGQAYQFNTNVNGINRFFPANFEEYDYSYGDIMRLKVRDRFVRVFQKFKVGTVPLFNQISKNADGTQLNVVTDKLLNPIQYYSGDFGIGENKESLASFNFADYFTTNIRGVICRVSNDGLTPISTIYKINSWANENLVLRTGNYKVYGAYDARLNNYICALEAVGSNEAKTIIFDEENNGFESFVSYFPEMMVTLGTQLISFKNGGLYTHDSSVYNNFYGIQYDSTITPVFNQNPTQSKSFIAIEQRGTNVWSCPQIETSLNSYGTTKQQSNLLISDFAQYEDKFAASLLRDSNSIGGLINGDYLKGNYIQVQFKNTTPNTLVSLNFVSLKYIDSPLNNR